ncbi:MAG: hypothetical protein LBV61_02140 [Burkholderiaceae bacterium]|jgi:tetratricopeptide (TPR) repeat protein|nr:hypothetical protein [Burkholderiaceae bacterium]
MTLTFPFPAVLVAIAVLLQGCESLPADPPGVLGSPAQARAGSRATGSRPDEWAPSVVPRPSPDAEYRRAALRAAENAYAKGDWAAAAWQFKALSDTYPGNSEIWFGYGAASALLGNLEDAASGFQAALSVDAQDVRAAYNLSLIRLAQANMALGIARRNVASAPEDIQREVDRLSNDLSPLFDRSAGLIGKKQPKTGVRTQNPVRPAQTTESLPSEVKVTLPFPASTP